MLYLYDLFIDLVLPRLECIVQHFRPGDLSFDRASLRRHVRLVLWFSAAAIGISEVDKAVAMSFFVMLIEVVWADDGSFRF